MRERIPSQSGEAFTVLAKQLALKPMAQHPIGFSVKALDADEESLISDVSRVPGNPCLSQSEIEKCMRDRLVKNRDEILKALQSIVISWPGRVKKKKLFEMINGFWIAITSQQFETLVSDIQEYGDGSIDFRQLFMKIEGKRRMKYGLSLSDKSKYGLPAPPSLTSSGLDFLLQAKINSNIKEVTRGLRMYQERNGLIRRQALKKVLDTFAIATKPSQFNNLMRFYDPHNTGFVNLHNFLIELGTHVRNYVKQNPDQITASDVFNWNEPYFDELDVNMRKNALKYNKNDPDLANLSIPEIIIKFEDKVGKNIEDLTKCFLTYDIANSGLVSLQDFRNVLSYFVYPTSDSLFREIKEKLAIKKVGNMIAWEQFLETVKQKVSASPKAQKPVVHRWNKDPHEAIWTRTSGAEICKCGDLTNLQHPLTLKGIMEKLRKFNVVPGPVTRKIFTVRTNVGERLITRSDFKLFLGRRCCILSEREMTDLQNLLDPDHKNMITYNRFQTLFCENPPVIAAVEKPEQVQVKKSSEWCKPRYNMAETAVTNMAACFPDLSPEDALIKLRRHIHKHWNNFSKTLLARAHGRNGLYIYLEELRLILDVLVMQLTDMQWQHLLKKMGITTGQLNAQYFLDAFAILDVEALDRWNRTVFRLFGDEQRNNKAPVHEDDFQKRLLDLMETRGKEIHHDLVKLDAKSFGFVGRKGFRKLISKYMPDMNDDMFDDLWGRLPTNEYNNVDYEWFLRKYKHFYSQPPDHRCQCECEYANKSDAKPVDEGEADAYRLLAGGMQADKKPEAEIIAPKVPPVEKKADMAPSTSNNVKESESSVTTLEEEGVVHVPFRPPTPPKHQHHKDSSSGPLVIHKSEDAEHEHPHHHHHDQHHRQSAGMDLRYHPDYIRACEHPYGRPPPKSASSSSSSKQFVRAASSQPCSRSSSGANSGINSGPKSRVGSAVGSTRSTRSSGCRSSDRLSCACPCRRPRTACASGEELLKGIIDRKWREIRLELNKLDLDGMGHVKNEEFRACLGRHGVPMTIEMDAILKRFAVPNAGPVNYLQFLQAFVIHLQPEEITVTSRRKYQQVPTIPLGSPSAGLYDTLLSLKAPVLAHFVDLRRVLRSHDKTGRGWIHAIDFRKLLRHFNLSLTDERFFFLMEYFDPNLTGHFHYNEFLRIFTSIR